LHSVFHFGITFQKVYSPMSDFGQVLRGRLDKTLIRDRQNDCLALNTNTVFFNQHLTLNHKHILVRRMKLSQHGNYVNGDVAKTRDTSSLHFSF